MWPGYDPSSHHRAIAQKLEAVQAGKIKRLMIFMPPRHGKSMLCSEFFPAWALGLNPEQQIIFATYAQELAEDYGRRVRNSFKDSICRAVFPGVTLAADSSAACKFNIGERGAYFAVGVGGAITGRGANLLIIDDPLKSRKEADSETTRRHLKDWYSSVAYTRLMPSGALVLIQTRWHNDDLAGWLLKEHPHENWAVLSLPALDTERRALWPERYPVSALERIQSTLSSRDWASLYQQSPITEGGNILKSEYWKLWNRDTPSCVYVLQSWDTAFSDKDLKSNSYSARTTWGVFCDKESHLAAILLEAWRGRVDYPTLKTEALKAYKSYQPDCVLIEKKASGQSLIQDLRASGLPISAYQPDRDKVARAYAVQAMLESGQIYRPSRRWADAVVDECAQFPNGESNDWVDTCTQAWLKLRNAGLLIASPPPARFDDDDDEDWTPSRRSTAEPMHRGVYG